MDLEAFARAVDDRVISMPAGCDPARLFGVRMRGDDFLLLPLWSGYAREVPLDVVSLAGLRAIVLETTGWTSPMDEGRPSEHPLRKRVHQTVVISGLSDDISVLRYDDAEPQVLRGAIGFVLDLLVESWQRRPDATLAS